MVRFKDVIKNYFFACCARLSVDDNLYQHMSVKKWGPIIKRIDADLDRYLRFEILLPAEYASVDFFAAD